MMRIARFFLIACLWPTLGFAREGIEVEYNRFQDRTYVELNIKEVEFSFQHGGKSEVPAPGWVRIDAQNPNKSNSASQLTIVCTGSMEIRLSREKGFLLDIPHAILRWVALSRTAEFCFGWDDGKTWKATLEEKDLMQLREFTEYGSGLPGESVLEVSGPTAFIVDCAMGEGALSRVTASLDPVINTLASESHFMIVNAANELSFSTPGRITVASDAHKARAKEMLAHLRPQEKDLRTRLLDAVESSSNVNLDTIVLFTESTLPADDLRKMVDLCRLRQSRLHLVLCDGDPDNARVSLARIVAAVSGHVELLGQQKRQQRH